MTAQKRPGGRTERTRIAVCDAAFAIAADSGYAGLSIDAIAERSGVHKTTIYRRWGSVDKVLLDAIVHRAETAIPLSQTGDARLDLVSMARSVAANLQDPVARAVVGAVLSRAGEGNLRQLSDSFWNARIAGASEIVRAGQRDGQIDSVHDPLSVVIDIIGPIWFSVLVLGSPVDDPFLAALVDRAIR